MQIGAFESKPDKIAEVLASWLGPRKPEFEAMAVRAKAFGEKWQNALFRIVEDLAAMVHDNALPNTVCNPLKSQRNSWELGTAT